MLSKEKLDNDFEYVRRYKEQALNLVVKKITKSRKLIRIDLYPGGGIGAGLFLLQEDRSMSLLIVTSFWNKWRSSSKDETGSNLYTFDYSIAVGSTLWHPQHYKLNKGIMST